MAVKLGKGKVAGINSCANDGGVIAAAAMDQRGSLEKAIAKARGTPATPDDLASFKKAVTSVLTLESVSWHRRYVGPAIHW